MRKLRIHVYSFVRIFAGIILILHATRSAFDYYDFLENIGYYFQKASFFDLDIFYYGASLSPFAEFGIGILLIFGLFTRRTLLSGIFLFAGGVLLLIDITAFSFVGYYFILAALMYALYKFQDYNVFSLDDQLKPHPLN